MQTEQFHVPAISCQHCVRAVTNEVSKLVGVGEIKVDLDSKVVTVAHNEFVAPDAIVAAIKEAGYDEVARV
ncbi:MAG: heavy-metal-associated domain-containing protein [Oscillochloridaceae bacterium umkhey_bin13]